MPLLIQNRISRARKVDQRSADEEALSRADSDLAGAQGTHDRARLVGKLGIHLKEMSANDFFFKIFGRLADGFIVLVVFDHAVFIDQHDALYGVFIYIQPL